MPAYVRFPALLAVLLGTAAVPVWVARYSPGGPQLAVPAATVLAVAPSAAVLANTCGTPAASSSRRDNCDLRAFGVRVGSATLRTSDRGRHIAAFGSGDAAA